MVSRPLSQRCCLIRILAIVFTCACTMNGSVGRSDETTQGVVANSDVTVSRFLFRYHVTVTGLPPNKTADVWVPVAASDKHQAVTIRSVALPGSHRMAREERFGNSMFFLKAVADQRGRIPIAVDYEVRRDAVTPQSGEELTAREREQFLRANQLVPLGGRPLELLSGTSLVGDSREAVRKIYDVVDDHVSYDKPAGGAWGRGDAVWVCDSRFGNCTDFHSLFISLCRSNGVPARFQIGFPVGPQQKGVVGGYHCWAQFADGDRWFSVDISEADKNPARKDYYFGSLPPDRVIFSTGRDLTLEPEQASGPLNYFVYPHVEVDGKAYTELEKDFSFELLR